MVFLVVTSSAVFFLYPKKNYSYIEIPIKSLNNNQDYYLKVNIEGKDLLMEIDTGACNCFTLFTKFFDKIKNKKPAETSQWKDINGNEYISKNWLIDSIKMCKKLWVNNVPVEEESEDFILKGSKIDSDDPPSNATLEAIEKLAGRMGISSLRGCPRWLLDFPRSRLIMIEKLDDSLRRLNLSLKNFTEVALDPSFTHMVIDIDTDIGIKKFIVDTGANLTVLKPNPVAYDENGKIADKKEWITFSEFFINGKNFGPHEVLLFNRLHAEKNTDGFLGMDFLENRAILIDFENNKVFIGEKENDISFVEIPVEYLKASNRYCVNANIEGKDLLIDSP